MHFYSLLINEICPISDRWKSAVFEFRAKMLSIFFAPPLKGSAANLEFPNSYFFKARIYQNSEYREF